MRLIIKFYLTNLCIQTDIYQSLTNAHMMKALTLNTSKVFNTMQRGKLKTIDKTPLSGVKDCCVSCMFQMCPVFTAPESNAWFIFNASVETDGVLKRQFVQLNPLFRSGGICKTCRMPLRTGVGHYRPRWERSSRSGKYLKPLTLFPRGKRTKFIPRSACPEIREIVWEKKSAPSWDSQALVC